MARAADDDDAAGTVPAAKVFVMGVGVAGLQAIATARRVGAIVTATTYVRPQRAGRKPGAKFLAVETKNSRTRRLPAATPRKCRKNIRPSRPRSRRAHQEAGHRHHHRAIPGRRATAYHAAMVASMRWLGDHRSGGRRAR